MEGFPFFPACGQCWRDNLVADVPWPHTGTHTEDTRYCEIKNTHQKPVLYPRAGSAEPYQPIISAHTKTKFLVRFRGEGVDNREMRCGDASGTEVTTQPTNHEQQQQNKNATESLALSEVKTSLCAPVRRLEKLWRRRRSDGKWTAERNGVHALSQLSAPVERAAQTERRAAASDRAGPRAREKKA